MFFSQPVTATQRVPWTNSVTKLQACASVNRELWVGSAQTASLAGGPSPAVVPVIVMAMQISVTPTLENVKTAGTTLQDTNVNSKMLSYSQQ